MCCYRFLQESSLDSSGLIEGQKYREGVNRMGRNTELIGAAYCGIVRKIRQACALNRDNSERVSTVI